MTSKTTSHVTENQSHVTKKSGSNFTGPKKAGQILRDRNKRVKFYGTGKSGSNFTGPKILGQVLRDRKPKSRDRKL